jgi:glycerol uptake facilitator-like aquaporin
MEEAPAYVLAQMAGATFAGAVNYAIFASGIAAMEASEAIVRGSAASTASFAGAFGMVPNPLVMGPVGAFVAEVWMTGILLFLIAALTDTAAGSVPDGAAPALIGGTVGVLIGTFGPVTGCGMNPARDLGPRLVTLATGWGGAALTSGWVYTLGPLIGGPLGMMCYRQLLMPSKKAE